MYVFDNEVIAFFLISLCARLGFLYVEKIRFEIMDVRDDDGTFVYLRILYQDLTQLQSLILEEHRDMFTSLDASTRVAAYLAKAPLCSYDYSGEVKYRELWHAVTLIQVALWHAKQVSSGQGSPDLWLYDRGFFRGLETYARSFGVKIHQYGAFHASEMNFWKFRSKLLKFKPRLLGAMLRVVLVRFFREHAFGRAHPKKPDGPSRMMVEYYGHLNLDRPGRVSDLVFLDEQGIHGSDICLVFNGSWDPVDRKKLEEMSRKGVSAVALTPQSSLVDESLVPVFRYQGGLHRGTQGLEVPLDWTAPMAEYRRLRDYWGEFFRRYDIRLCNLWTKYEASHIALADALAELGGITTIYQRSYETGSSPNTAVGCDVIFGFNQAGYQVELGSRSDFRYYVVTGYVGDVRFEHLHPFARALRDRLQQNGARRIIAYFDENTIDDGRWFVGHRFLQDNYVFWLEKVFQDPELAIIFKPKNPANLCRRLGPIASLLKRAEMTGRCYVLGEGIDQGSFPPAAAALASDIAIHDTLSAGTAGLDSALAGNRTILMDLEGWPRSPLYRLGPDVVFKDWPSVWQVCTEYFKDPQSHPRLGDWSSMINELDPFHDGRAAERMSHYLKDLLDGLRAGDAPATVMERAAERYARQWGKDKVQRPPREWGRR